MVPTPDQNVHTVFSAHEMIAAAAPPPATGLRAPALLRAALLRPQVPRTTHTRTRWWQIALDLLREGGLLAARDAPRGQRRVAFWGALVYQTLWLIALIWFAFARRALPEVRVGQKHGPARWSKSSSSSAPPRPYRPAPKPKPKPHQGRWTARPFPPAPRPPPCRHRSLHRRRYWLRMNPNPARFQLPIPHRQPNRHCK